MNSNEEYLDSLLKSVEEKEASIQEAGIVQDLSELDGFSLPEELNLQNDIKSEEQDIFAEYIENPVEEAIVETMVETMEEPMAEFIEEPMEESMVESVVEAVEEPIEEPEIIVQSGDTLLDILKNNPDRLLSPEQIENMFAHAEEENSMGEMFKNDMAVEETSVEEALTDELVAENFSADGFDFESELDSMSESDIPVVGDTLFGDDVQNLAEDEIMRLLQKSSDVSQNSDDGMNLDFLFDDMNGDANVAEIEAMIDKAENNEPVSSEVEEMIQLGLKVDAGEEIPLQAASPKVIISKIKDGFVNIFKKEKGEKDKKEKKEKKEKKTKGKKSLFSRKNKKNKQADTEEMQLSNWDSIPASTDVPLWDNVQESSDIPLWDNVQESSDIPLWDNTADASDVPMMDETEELDEFAMMKKMMAKAEAEAEAAPKEENNNNFFDQLFGNSTQETSDIPLWDNTEDESDIPLWDNEQDVSDEAPKNDVDTSFFDQLFTDDSNVEAESVSQEEFGGFVEGLFGQEPEVQMNNNDASEISDLLNSLENAETEADLGDTNVDLFAGMNQEGETDLGNVGELDNIRDLDAEKAEKKEKKPGFFKRLFTLLTEEDEEPDEILVTAGNADGVDELGSTSEENKEAMAQLDKEGPDDKKKKKKGKKGKKGEKDESDVKDDDDEDEDEEPIDNKKKKQKPKKQKKQKEPKFYDDSPKLSKKKVKAAVLASITVAAAILVGSLFIPELFELRSARNAFYDGDYATSYKALYGKKLSDSDKIIFEQSEFLLALQRRVESYYNYMAIDDELRAVESLILETAKQDDILIQAEKYGLIAEADNSYQNLLQILNDKYGVSEAEALKISGYRQDALFTLHIRAIVAGEEFVCPDYLVEYVPTDVDVDVQDQEIIEETLEDILPEEEELIEAEFEEGTN